MIARPVTVGGVVRLGPVGGLSLHPRARPTSERQSTPLIACIHSPLSRALNDADSASYFQHGGGWSKCTTPRIFGGNSFAAGAGGYDRPPFRLGLMEDRPKKTRREAASDTTPLDSSLTLLERAQAGDRAALDALIARYLPR